MLITLSFILTIPVSSYAADDSVCARVKIEIQQELTLERQAFDAHMRINNGLSHITLEHVDIDVNFADEAGNSILATSDPNNTTASFFIRVDTLDNISNITGSGTVSPSTSADIHWLIIPAPGAAKGVPSGTLYYVGATLRYTIGGEEHVTEVTPDYIFVKPMPLLTLDYFLPVDVYGDDAFTSEVEPPVPFSLGVRVSNNGSGTARALKIDSAQPKITENELGAIIGFNIEGCKVNGGEVTPSLMVDLGDVSGSSAKVASWIMTCSLSGRFVEFTADFSHSDELGGELTSLMEAANTHFLVHEVLADSAGKDVIPDFLAKDGDIYRLYESQKIDTVVTDQSSSSSITASGGNYALSTPQTAGYMYVKLPDPMAGSSDLGEITRSDGKAMKAENVWLSKTRGENHAWNYFINMFDTNSTGSYTVRFVEAANQPHPPVLQFIPDRTVQEGQQLSFIVEASDEDGTTPALSTSSLPARANFTDQGDGTGIFNWTPEAGQAGTYPITFIASDGTLQDTKKATIRVTPAGDTDGDGIPDDWERQHFGNLDRNGTGDYDGDGISDLDEYLRGSDPLTPNQAPTIPVIQSPGNASEITTLQASLSVEASTDPDNDPVKYTFELYADQGMTSLVGRAEGIDATSWTVPSALSDNTWYYWRAQASDGFALTNWAYGSFFVNTANDAPTVPLISSPSEFDTRAPVLQVTNSHDIDGDRLTYAFMVYADSALTTLAASVSGFAQGQEGTTSWTVSPLLTNNTTYFWKAVITDEHGLSSETSAASFLVHMENTAPSAPAIQAPAQGEEAASTEVELTVTNSTDAEGDSLAYYFELDTVPTFDSTNLLTLAAVPEQPVRTSCIATELSDNTLYYWRVKAGDGTADSAWSTGSFFVNTANDAPGVPVLKNPASSAWVSTLTPALEIFPSTDPDLDSITYTYDVYADENMSVGIASTETESTSWSIPVGLLSDNTWYYWRVRARDEHGLNGPWMQVSRFFTDSNGVNDGPSMAFTNPAQHVYTNGESIEIAWTDNDPDSNATISLYYDTDNRDANGTLIAAGIAEDPDGQADRYQWDISGQGDVTYYIYAVITDGVTTQTVYCPYPVTIDRTLPAVTADPPAGNYTSVQNVSLTANEAAVIHYTTDGTDPSASSTVYTAPIEISQNTELRFIAVDQATNISPVVTAAYTVELDIQEFTVSVRTSSGSAVSKVRVYAFTEAGSYVSLSSMTNTEGDAVFDAEDFGPGNYKFRIDYMGGQFWSETIAMPGSTSVNVIIEEELVRVDVNVGSGPVQGVRVYLFSSTGSYLGSYVLTDASGSASFRLPVGQQFRFRVDYLGSQYWSDTVQVQQGVPINLDVNTGGGSFSLTVQKSPGNPLPGLRAYLFSATGSYLGKYATTDGTGRVTFDVSRGTYKVRVDYLGYQFWSADTAVDAVTSITTTIPHQDVEIEVSGVCRGAASALSGVSVYLFTPGGSYIGQSLQTDSTGLARFSLPQTAYKVRADYLGRQYFSNVFTWQDASVDIPMADAEITVLANNQPKAGVKVYAFSGQGSYPGLSGTTNTSGKVVFRLPADTYTFRADYSANQYWSDSETLTVDQVTPVEINMGGGSFTLSVLKGADVPLVGVKCYVFNESGAYISLNGTTNTNGEAGFELPGGSYQFRIDYLGAEFWTELISVPGTLRHTELIPHHEVAITVEGLLGADSRPVIDVPVYLFSPLGGYLSVSARTDSNGQIKFSLPQITCMVRADYLGKQYFSDSFTWQDAVITIPEGIARVFVSMAGQALSSRPVYVYSAANSYIGVQGTTNSQGIVEFRLPADTYNFRADYQGSQFWASAGIEQDVVNNVTVSAGGGTFTLSVDSGQSPLTGAKIYVFSPSGSYLGTYSTTNTQGQASFALSSGRYKFRVDYLGYQFWSDIYDVPAVLSGVLSIPHQNVVITVEEYYDEPTPKQGIRVYLFTPAGSYLSSYLTTGAGGTVTFRLPNKPYKVRCDYLGQQFWSEEFQFRNATVTIDSGLMSIFVSKSGAMQSGARVYLFSEGNSYLGLYKTTDIDGIADFVLPNRSFKFRIDYAGQQKWTPVFTVLEGQDQDVEVNLDE